MKKGLLPTHPAGTLSTIVVCKRGSVVINIAVKEAASKWEIKHFPLPWEIQTQGKECDLKGAAASSTKIAMAHLQTIIDWIVLF